MPLRYSLKGARRLRVEDWRVVCTIDPPDVVLRQNRVRAAPTTIAMEVTFIAKPDHKLGSQSRHYHAAMA